MTNKLLLYSPTSQGDNWQKAFRLSQRISLQIHAVCSQCWLLYSEKTYASIGESSQLVR